MKGVMDIFAKNIDILHNIGASCRYKIFYSNNFTKLKAWNYYIILYRIHNTHVYNIFHIILLKFY